MPASPTSSRRRAAPVPRVKTVGELVAWAARRLARAPLHYGHGTDNPLDEAGALVFHALGIGHDEAPGAYARQVEPAGRRRAAALIARRIRERIPSAYLTGRTWFAGHEIEVTPDVLVPRSPLAEMCERSFVPWIDPGRVRRVLDIGTGSGCIAIACAYAFAGARVDAADVSPAALAVASRNIRTHGLEQRVRPVLSDVYDGIGKARYDIIVSNPPYVSEAEMRALPREYRREPAPPPKGYPGRGGRRLGAAGARGLARGAIHLARIRTWRGRGFPAWRRAGETSPWRLLSAGRTGSAPCPVTRSASCLQ
jgi:ribosomal protein L3 glutamine methyltransferase